MEFARRGPATAEADENGGRCFPDLPPPHGDAMLVIRDALLSQLQNDRLRQEIIMVELGKIERAMALRSASHQGIASAVAERAEPAPFAFSEQFMTHSRGAVSPERKVGVDEAHDLKKKDGVHGGVELKSKKPAMEDLVRVCLKTSCSNDKAGGQENAALNECKLQKSNETILSKRTSPTVKWSCAICLVEATSQGNLLQHFAGLKHRSNVIALEAEAKAEKSRKVRQYAEKPRPTWNCRFCQADCTCKSDLENHLKGKRHQAKIQALLEECKSMARNFVHWEADSHPNIVPQDEDKPASSTCSICQSTTERTSSGLNRKLTAATPLMKMQKPLGEWSCTLCQVNLTCQRNLHEHLAGRLHQTNVEALHTRNKPAELNAKAIPDEWNKNSAKNSEHLCRDGRENVAENSGPQQGEKPRGKDNVNVHKPAEKDRPEPAVSRWTCSLCQAKFTCESDYHDHLRGRRDRENTEALRAEFRSHSGRRDAERVLLRSLRPAVQRRQDDAFAPRREAAPGDARGPRMRRRDAPWWQHDVVHGEAVRQGVLLLAVAGLVLICHSLFVSNCNAGFGLCLVDS